MWIQSLELRVCRDRVRGESPPLELPASSCGAYLPRQVLGSALGGTYLSCLYTVLGTCRTGEVGGVGRESDYQVGSVGAYRGGHRTYFYICTYIPSKQVGTYLGGLAKSSIPAVVLLFPISSWRFPRVLLRISALLGTRHPTVHDPYQHLQYCLLSTHMFSVHTWYRYNGPLQGNRGPCTRELTYREA